MKLIGYQASSKYPDGTILMVTGDESDGRDSVIGSFVAFRTGYEEETGTAKFPNPTAKMAGETVSYDQGVANAATLTAQDSNSASYATPMPPNSNALPDGALHPTKTCAICHAPRKVVDRPKKGGGRYRKLECSVDYKHKPDDWSENYK